MHGGHNLHVYLCQLFNSMLIHGISPSSLQTSTLVGETGASWRTGQDDESALASNIITILPLSVCHTCHHVRAQLISE